jgi:hypothetical protein
MADNDDVVPPPAGEPEPPGEAAAAEDDVEVEPDEELPQVLPNLPVGGRLSAANVAALATNAQAQTLIVMDQILRIPNLGLAQDDKAEMLRNIRRAGRQVGIAQLNTATLTLNEKRLKRPPTVTRLYPDPAPLGRNNADNIKVAKIPEYTGHGSNQDAISWLSKIINAAQTANLQHSACLALMRHRSAGSAYARLEQLQDDESDLEETVSVIETEFAKIPGPVEAKAAVNSMVKPEKESLASFTTRVRWMAKMAVRDIQNLVERKRQELWLTKNNFYRVLSQDTNHYLLELEANAARSGQPEMSMNDLIREASVYERDKVQREHRQQAEKDLQTLQWNNQRTGFRPAQRVNRVKAGTERIPEAQQVCFAQGYDSEDIPVMAEEGEAAASNWSDWNPNADEGLPEDEVAAAEAEVEIDEEELYDAVNFVRYFRGRGGVAGMGRAARGAFRPRQPPQRPVQGRPQRFVLRRTAGIPPARFGQRQVTTSPSPTGENVANVANAMMQQERQLAEKKIPVNLNEAFPHLNPKDLPRLANCVGEPDRCIRCGITTSPPHRAGEPSCQLFQHELTSKPCLICGKGLHTADNCLKPHQKNFSHPADKGYPLPKN